MNRSIRILMFVIAISQIFLAISLFLQMPWIKTIWPFDYTDDLSFIFMSSIAGAAAASTLWCVYHSEEAGFSGIALDYVAIFTPLVIFSIQKYSRFRSSDLIPVIVIGIFVGIFGIGLMVWSRRQAFRYTLPTPRPIRIAFGIFIVALVVLGGALVLKTDNIMPWTLTDDASVLYGWFFIGAAVYFAYGLMRPLWGNAGGQLSGFLAYDLVLIIPFLQHFASVKPNLVLNLVIYIAVLVFSGVLAVYYLFIHPATRMRRVTAASNVMPQMTEGRAV